MTDTRVADDTTPNWLGQTALDGATLPTPRRRGAECLSDLLIDRLTLGELTPEQKTAAENHLAGCPACRTAHRALTFAAERFVRETDIATLAARSLQSVSPQRTSWFARWLVPSGLAAAVGLGSLLFVARAPLRTDGMRTKGGFSLTTYVQHAEGDAPATLHLGEPLHPRDRLQFRYSGQESGHLIILSVDGTGQVSVYYPPGPRAAPVSAGREVPLETAVELDDSVGTETILGLRCTSPVTVQEAQSAVERAGGQVAGRGLPCVDFRQRLTKVPL